ncbi:S41 family peptidase [uncultured Psychroserpens sp.]|uniref:S41 family peptidase n=1 Tax=uncultured Psychroserpens sp. TaxID=255436 RepID=UPI00261CB686|nr:S41 family peptidase [uncultured Psychroserpens sp.]
MSKIRVCFLLIAVMFSCSDNEITAGATGTSAETDNTNNISLVARNYLNEVIAVMQNNSINKYTVDWNQLRHEAFGELDVNAQTIEDTYPGISKAIALLGDNHSLFITSTGSYINPHSNMCEGVSFSNVDVPDNIGYVKISNFNGSSNLDGMTFAQNIQDDIIAQDHSNVEGWIVDLRANTGGNMWPMLTGVGPILGNGTSGYFVDADDVEMSFGFDNGMSILDGNVVMELTNSYTLINPNPKVAVLLDNGVASSGEAIAVSFINRPNTRTFGNATCGLSTANTPFVLSDGGKLVLTTAYFADRDLNLFGEQIDPEIETSVENTLDTAINWIVN